MKKPIYNALRMVNKKYADNYGIKMKKYEKYLQKIFYETNVSTK